MIRSERVRIFFFPKCVIFQSVLPQGLRIRLHTIHSEMKEKKKDKDKRNMFFSRVTERFNTNVLISLFLWLGGESGVLYLYWYCKKNFLKTYIHLFDDGKGDINISRKKNSFRWLCPKYFFFFWKWIFIYPKHSFNKLFIIPNDINGYKVRRVLIDLIFFFFFICLNLFFVFDIFWKGGVPKGVYEHLKIFNILD